MPIRESLLSVISDVLAVRVRKTPCGITLRKGSRRQKRQPKKERWTKREFESRIARKPLPAFQPATFWPPPVPSAWVSPRPHPWERRHVGATSQPASRSGHAGPLSPRLPHQAICRARSLVCGHLATRTSLAVIYRQPRPGGRVPVGSEWRTYAGCPLRDVTCRHGGALKAPPPGAAVGHRGASRRSSFEGDRAAPPHSWRPALS